MLLWLLLLLTGGIWFLSWETWQVAVDRWQVSCHLWPLTCDLSVNTKATAADPFSANSSHWKALKSLIQIFFLRKFYLWAKSGCVLKRGHQGLFEYRKIYSDMNIEIPAQKAKYVA